jgi:hypothetical protein
MSKQDLIQEHKDCLDKIKAVLENNESDYTKIFTISGISNRHISTPRYWDEEIDGLYPSDEMTEIITSEPLASRSTSFSSSE